MRRLLRRAAASAPASPLTPETATAELRITGLSHRWANGQTILDDCNLVIPKPGLWMLVGCNGSGKSTLFRLIAGLIEPQSGSISTDHQSALVFQNPDHQLLLPSCSSDLLLGMDQGLGNSERRERIRLRLEELGLAGLERRPIHALSGGQKQRLAIASALLSGAQLLLLDESNKWPKYQRFTFSSRTYQVNRKSCFFHKFRIRLIAGDQGESDIKLFGRQIRRQSRTLSPNPFEITGSKNC